MSRLMSMALTEQAVVERRKTVTRRLGWWTDKNGRRLLVPGDRLTLCRKVMGRARSCTDCGGTGIWGDPDVIAWNPWVCTRCDGTGTEPLVRLAEAKVVDVSREPLWHVELHDGDVAAEGFPGKSTEWFIRFFCDHMGGHRAQDVTRIEFRYLDPEGES